MCHTLPSILAIVITSSAAPGMVPRAYAQPQASASTDARTDHEQVIRRIGVGWYGVSTIFVGTQGTTVVAPSIGARYWLDESFGIDAALGFAFSAGGSSQTTGGMTTEADSPSTFGFLLHAGVPISLFSGPHYTFVVVPEVNIGYARIGSDFGDPMMPMTRSDRGFRLDFGGRAGAEIQFGFIGVPELALEASVGVTLSHQRQSFSVGDVTSGRIATTSLQTLSVNDPWDFFRSTVAARYYF